ncbi:hypothetical protein LKM01_18040 [Bacillus pacificus]|uniref:hypothetical protein n=1 Tax=Bacillus pacificus TaxID=2026187 RepID=UPI001E48A398|nr:hypothetical protein [Bacillus pacificus]MCC2483728.1 hypothetical protein [Bacillus pacificus]
MTAELFKVNANNIVGGAGRLITAPYGVKLPDKISEVMSLETYDLTAPWKDLGATQEGITVSRSYEEEGTEVDQVQGEVETSITKWEHTLATLLAENTIENRQLTLIGSKIVETAPKYGTAVKSANALAAGASLIALATAPGTDFKAGSYLKIGSETQKIAQISGNTLILDGTLEKAYETSADVLPLKELGSKRIGYGTVSTAPFITVVLISKKKDGTLAMLVIPKAKVSGESKEQKWSKEKRTLPFALKAFAQDNMPTDSNVYYEIEETL